MLAMNFKLSVSLLIILALTLASIGCATAPETKAVINTPTLSSGADKYAVETEKAATKAAMDAAVSSDAEKYAAADLNAARKIWEIAESQMKDEKFTEAKKSYAAAKAYFDRATANVEEGRKMAAAEANEAIANLEKAWENVKVAANNVKKKMKDKDMRDDWAAFTKTFPDDMKATRDKIVTDPAGAKANVDELMSIIERWDSAFKELSAAPATNKAAKPEAKPTKTKKK